MVVSCHMMMHPRLSKIITLSPRPEALQSLVQCGYGFLAGKRGDARGGEIPWRLPGSGASGPPTLPTWNYGLSALPTGLEDSKTREVYGDVGYQNRDLFKKFYEDLRSYLKKCDQQYQHHHVDGASSSFITIMSMVVSPSELMLQTARPTCPTRSDDHVAHVGRAEGKPTSTLQLRSAEVISEVSQADVELVGDMVLTQVAQMLLAGGKEEDHVHGGLMGGEGVEVMNPRAWVVVSQWGSRRGPTPFGERTGRNLFSGPMRALTSPLHLHGLLQVYLQGGSFGGGRGHDEDSLWAKVFGMEVVADDTKLLQTLIHDYVSKVQMRKAGTQLKSLRRSGRQDPGTRRSIWQAELAFQRARGDSSGDGKWEDMLVFEALSKLLLRPEQVVKLQEMVGGALREKHREVLGLNDGFSDLLDLQRQAPMGVGKSEVYTPFWMFSALSRGNLAVLVLPDALYESGARSLRKNIAKFSGTSSVFYLEFSRKDAFSNSEAGCQRGGRPSFAVSDEEGHDESGHSWANPFQCPLSRLLNALEVALATNTPVVTRSRDLHMLSLAQIALLEEQWQLREQHDLLASEFPELAKAAEEDAWAREANLQVLRRINMLLATKMSALFDEMDAQLDTTHMVNLPVDIGGLYERMANERRSLLEKVTQGTFATYKYGGLLLVLQVSQV